MIRPDTIARVKERTDIVAVIAESVRLTRRGRTFVGLCPFHKEKTPSFHVNPERAIFHCFGCKESGSAIDFVMKTEGHTFPEAIRLLADRAGVVVEEAATDAEQREAAAARRAKDDLYGVNALAATFFEHSLNGGPGGFKAHPLAHLAKAELTRRGLTPLTASDPIADALQAFRIGYAPFGWDALATYLKQQGISPITAERAGLLVPRSTGSGHYDRFRHRLMFAVIDVMGRVIAFSGRALADPTPEELTTHQLTGPSPPEDGRAPAKYINSPESPIYTKGEHLFGLFQARHAIRQGGEGVLVEGNFDVMSLHARGVTHVVAPLGTAFTAQQAKLLKRFAPNVTILFDGDAAGRKATRASRIPCQEGGLAVKVASLPDGVDPDDLVQRKGKEALEPILKNAREMMEYLLEDALDPEAFQTGSIVERTARVRAAVELVREQKDPSLRLLVKSLADRLSAKLAARGGGDAATLSDLHAQLVHATSAAPQPERPQTMSGESHERARSRPNEDKIPLEILGALLDFPDLLDEPEVGEAIASLEGEVALAVLALRQARGPHLADTDGATSSVIEEGFPGSQKGIYTDEFLAQIARPIHPFAVGRLASPRFEVLGDAKLELLENARKLSRLSLSRENAATVEELHRAEAQGDVAFEDAKLYEIMRRAQKKHGLA